MAVLTTLSGKDVEPAAVRAWKEQKAKEREEEAKKQEEEDSALKKWRERFNNKRSEK